MIEDLIMVAIGAFAVVFSNTLAQFSADFQGRFYHVKLGPNVVKFARTLFIVIGTLFIVIGTLAAFNVINFK
jgi:hypothetical protein